uniref:ERCC4 domain-containing protein n=1 Tax=Heterorhabditis bacteriophora TaxID=37862 RepID=A0A1I7XQ12_HETBA
MLRHYPNSILLIESNRKFETKIVNGGPFQGELTRHCRDIRTLFCSLLRSNPELKLIWSLSPTNSAEYFSEVKLNCSDPDVDKAISLRSDDMPENESGKAKTMNLQTIFN